MLIPGSSYNNAIMRFNDGYKAEIDYSTKCIYPTTWMDIMSNHDLIVWLKWVNRNICLQLESDTIKTFNTTAVKLRIATGMLNNIKSLTDVQKITLHVNLTQNVKDEQSKIILKSLPF